MLYHPAKERKTLLGKVREEDGSLWERYSVIRNSEIWLHNLETDEWKLETRDELNNLY